MPNDFAATLKREMDLAGKTAKAVSLGAGLGATFVADILRGKSRRPAMHHVVALAEYLGIPPERLIGHESQPPRSAAKPANTNPITIRAESRPDGKLLIEIPGSAHLAQSEAVALLQLYGAAPDDARRAAMLRLRHPDLQPQAAQAGEKSQAERDQLFLAGVKAALIPLGFRPDTPEWFSAIATAFELRAREASGQPLAAAANEPHGRANPGAERRRQPA